MAAEFAVTAYERIIEAYDAVENPRHIDLEHLKNSAIITGLCFLVIGVIHRTFAVFFKRVYYTLHVVVNTIVTALVLPGTVRTLLNPSTSTFPATEAEINSHLYLCFIFALHVYHPIFFRTGLMDWIHHVPVYLVNILMFCSRFGDVMAFQAIVLTGVPGGVDYLLLVIEGQGGMSRATYKNLSAYINNWVRAPFGAISGYICILGVYNQLMNPAELPTTFELWSTLFLGIHAVWNPPFFGRQTIEANVVDIINRFDMHGNSQDHKQAIKLTKVRALSGKQPRPRQQQQQQQKPKGQKEGKEQGADSKKNA